MASNSFFFISGMEKPQLREKGDWPITTQSLGESSIRSCPPHSVASVVDRGEIAWSTLDHETALFRSNHLGTSFDFPVLWIPHQESS